MNKKIGLVGNSKYSFLTSSYPPDTTSTYDLLLLYTIRTSCQKFDHQHRHMLRGSFEYRSRYDERPPSGGSASELPAKSQMLGSTIIPIATVLRYLYIEITFWTTDPFVPKK